MRHTYSCILCRPITFFKNANDGFVALQLATKFLTQLLGTLKQSEFSTNWNYLSKMCIDLAKKTF